MPGGFGSPYRAPCGGWPAAPKLYLGCGGHSRAADKIIQRLKNTTIAPNDPCEPQTWATPEPRDENAGSPGDSGCSGGLPVGPWPEPVNNTYAVPPEGEAQTIDFSKCKKKGFKNVYAQKQWHGAPENLITVTAMDGDCQCQVPIEAVNDAPTFKYLQANISAEWVHKIDGALYYGLEGANPGNQSLFSTDLVNRLSGKRTGYATRYSQDADGVYDTNSEGFNSWLFSGLTPVLGLNTQKIIEIYCAAFGRANDKAAFYSETVTTTDGSTATFEYEKVVTTFDVESGLDFTQTWRYNGSITFSSGEIGVSLREQTRVDWYSYIDTIETTAIRLTGSLLTYEFVQTVNGYRGAANPEGLPLINEYIKRAAGRQYYTPYPWTQVQADLDTLLAKWNLGDDVLYPWRDTTETAVLSLHDATNTTNTIVTGGPLVTYNERGAVTPTIWPEGDLIDPENPAGGHYSWVDTSLPPRTNYPDGGIVGAPLPVGHEAFFDSAHIEYEFLAVTYGIEAFPKKYGQFSPFPHATQWLTNDVARYIPVGPFSTYNGLLHPELTKSDGTAILLPYGAMKCKWAEVAQRAAPSHNFFRPCGDDVRATWGSDYRPLCGRVPITSTTQSGGNVLIVLAEAAPGLITGDLVDFTGVAGLGTGLSATVTDSTHFSVPGTLTTSPTLGGYVKSNGSPSYGWNDTGRKGDFIYKVWVNDMRDFFESYRQRLAYLDAIAVSCSATNCDPVRYVAQTMSSGERDEIGTGSYWLKSLTVTEHCLPFSPCSPAVIYVSPNTETGHDNSVTLPMPGVGLVGDEIYGSLWLGRVEQIMDDPLGVVANEEARASLPSGAPDLPASATPLGCPDYVDELNADPQVVVGGACASNYTYVLDYIFTDHNYAIVSGEPNANYSFPWAL